MKKLAFLLVFCAVTIFSFAQELKESELPDPVKTTFNEKHPEAEEAQWELSKNMFGGTVYKSTFKEDGLKKVATFDGTGRWFETMAELDKDDIPEEVKGAINKEFSGEEVIFVEGERYDMASGFSKYEITVNTKNSDYKVRVNKDLKVIKKEAISN